MIAHDRRDNNQTDNGRRKLSDRRRSSSNSYNGIEEHFWTEGDRLELDLIIAQFLAIEKSPLKCYLTLSRTT